MLGLEVKSVSVFVVLLSVILSGKHFWAHCAWKIPNSNVPRLNVCHHVRVVGASKLALVTAEESARQPIDVALNNLVWKTQKEKKAKKDHFR